MVRIAGLHIDGFGIFRDFHLELFPGLNILIGHNEAGKTTLLHFIRAMLFGFENRSSAARYEPLNGGRYGGRMSFSVEGILYELERLAGRTSKGTVTLLCPEGSVKGEETLRQLLGNTSQALFNNVFAFSLEELQRLETLQADEVSGHIYSAGLGTGKTSLVEIENRLQKEMDALFRPAGRKEINVLLNELAQVEARISFLQNYPEEYEAKKQELASTSAVVANLSKELDNLTEEMDNLDRLLEAWPAWEKLVQNRRLLAELPSVEEFPENGVSRLENTKQRIDELQQQCDLVQQKLEQKTAERDTIAVDQGVLDLAPEISSLIDVRSAMEREVAAASDLGVKVNVGEKELDGLLKQLGCNWDKEKVASFDCSIAVREQVRSFRDAFRRTSEKQAGLQERYESAQKALTGLQREWVRAKEEFDEAKTQLQQETHPYEERVASLERALALAHETERARLQLEHLHQRLDDVRSRLDELESRQKAVKRPLPLWLTGLISAAAAASILAIHLLIRPLGVLSWGTVCLAFFLALLLNRRTLKRFHETKADLDASLAGFTAKASAIDSEVNSCTARLHSMEQERKECLVKAVGIGDPDEDDVLRAKRSLQAERETRLRVESLEEKVLDLSDKVKAAEEDRYDAGKALEEANQETLRLRKEWESWLTGLGLPSVTPDGALEFLGLIEKTKQVIYSLQSSTAEKELCSKRLEDFTQQVNAVGEHCGLDVFNASRAIEVVRYLGERLEKARIAARTKQELQKEIERLDDNLNQLRTELQREEGNLSALLAAGGAGDEEEFRHREALYERRRELLTIIQELEASLDLMAGRSGGRKSLETALSQTDIHSLSRQKEDAVKEISEMRTRLQKATEAVGALQGEIQRLEKSDELSAALLERNLLQTKLENRAREWAVRAVCKFALNQARAKYERERQPAVISQASKYFSQMTGGKYRQVVAPLGEKALLAVTDDGRRIPTANLSRGTAEQLFLSMRLALIEEHTKHSVGLPVIMDDVFVNFDPNRLTAAIETLRDFSSGHQVLFFTCHPHVADAMLEAAPEAHCYEIRH